MRTAIAVFAILLAAGFTGCAMNSNGYGGGLLSGLGGGCNSGCGQCCETGCNTGCDSGCGCESSSDCGGNCGNNCGCNNYKRGLFPGPLASRMMLKKNCGGRCDEPCNGMGELALFSRGSVRGRMSSMRGQLSGMRVSSDCCDSCGSTDGCDCSSGGLSGGGIIGGGLRGGGLMNRSRGGLLARTEPRWNNACGDCGQNDCQGGCGGRLRGQMQNRVLGGLLTGKGEVYGMGGRRCGAGCRRCGGRGLCRIGGRFGNPGAEHPYGGQIPHTDGFAGPHGPVSPTYAYPYYTTRGPRDFFHCHPSTIGR